MLLNRGLEPLLSPSPGMQSVLDPVEPPRLDNKLNALIAGYILSLTSVCPLPPPHVAKSNILSQVSTNICTAKLLTHYLDHRNSFFE